MISRSFKTVLFALFFLILSIGVVSCNNLDAANNKEKTDHLILYCHPQYTTMLQLAKQTFESRFPDVEVTFRTFKGEDREAEMQAYTSTLQTELMAGKGPDVIVFGDELDPYKVMDAGVFYDLDNFIEVDDTFDRTLYNETVLDGGIYKGQRLFVPLGYETLYVLTSEEALQDFHVSISDRPSFSEWSEVIRSYIDNHTELENRKLFQEVYIDLPYLMRGCGVQPIDYETGTVRVRDDAFRQFMEFFKAVYPYRYIEGVSDGLISPTLIEPIRNREKLFCLCVQDAVAFVLSPLLEETDTVRSFPLPNLIGPQPIAYYTRAAAINNASPNKANAYEFLKILLTPSVQNGISISLLISEQILNNLSYYTTYTMDNSQNYTLIEEHTLRLQNVISCPKLSFDHIKIIEKTMEPWINNESPYEECITTLEDNLQLYLYE